MRYRLLMFRQELNLRTQQGAFLRMMDGINRRQQRLDEIGFRLERAERQIVERWRRRWEIASEAVRHYDARQRLASVGQRLGTRVASLMAAMHTRLAAGHAVLDRRSAALEALSPLAILNRGYALVFDANGELVKDAEQVKAGDEIATRLARGKLRARVSEVQTSESGH